MKKYTKQELLDAFNHYADCDTTRVDHEENEYLESTMSSVMFVTLVEKLFYENEMGVMTEVKPNFKIGDKVLAKFSYEYSSTGNYGDGTKKIDVEANGTIKSDEKNELFVESDNVYSVAVYNNNGLMGTNRSRKYRAWYETHREKLKSPLSAILNAL